MDIAESLSNILSVFKMVDDDDLIKYEGGQRLLIQPSGVHLIENECVCVLFFFSYKFEQKERKWPYSSLYDF